MCAVRRRVRGGFREDPASRGVPDEGDDVAGGAGGVREEDRRTEGCQYRDFVRWAAGFEGRRDHESAESAGMGQCAGREVLRGSVQGSRAFAERRVTEMGS